MKALRYGTAAWDRYLDRLPRAGRPRAGVARRVAAIITEVRRDGDAALVRLTERFDGVRLTRRRLRVPAAEVRAAARAADPAVVDALRKMARRIEAFHARQKGRGFTVRLPGGARVEEIVGPVDSAGLYVPGGAGAYPSSVLMNAVPARVAGVPRLVVMTPPRTLEASPAVAAALVIAGLEDAVVRVGGAQAIAALAHGTETVSAVARVVGPGNAYVAEAKRQVRGRVEIDQEAGPSEVVVLADDTADAAWVAADLLAQAEHGSGEETVVLVTTDAALGAEVARRVAGGLRRVANPSAARRAVARFGRVVSVRDLDEGVDAVNALAPEHAEILCRGAAAVACRVVAGAVFVGRWSPVAAGDYGIGPNHVLPTGGAARFSSPLSVRDFERRHGRVTLTARALRRVGAGLARVAEAEGFPGHAASLAARL